MGQGTNTLISKWILQLNQNAYQGTNILTRNKRILQLHQKAFPKWCHGTWLLLRGNSSKQDLIPYQDFSCFQLYFFHEVYYFLYHRTRHFSRGFTFFLNEKTDTHHWLIKISASGIPLIIKCDCHHILWYTRVSVCTIFPHHLRCHSRIYNSFSYCHPT